MKSSLSLSDRSVYGVIDAFNPAPTVGLPANNGGQ
jgi:hypothetical protein